MYVPRAKPSSARHTPTSGRLHTRSSHAKTTRTGLFTAFVGLLATVNAGNVQAAAPPSFLGQKLNSSLTTTESAHPASLTPIAVSDNSPAILAHEILKPVDVKVSSNFVKRADPSPGFSFGEAFKQHKEIQDDLTDCGLKYERGAIVPDGDKKAKDKRKRAMWLGLGLGNGIPAAFLIGIAVHIWGPELFNFLRGSPAEAAKLFNIPNANIEILGETLDNLARETAPAPPPPIDAPVQGSTPLQPGQAANLPAQSSVQLTSGSTTNLGLAAGGSATLPAGAVAQAAAGIEVMTTIAGTVVTNVGPIAASVGVSVPAAGSGFLVIGPTAATLASQTGGQISAQVINGGTVLNMASASPGEMAGHLSDTLKVPDSWEAAKDAVRADQDQDANRSDKGKEPERPDDQPKDAGDAEQLRETRDEKRAESEKAEEENQKLERKIKEYEEKIEQEKKEKVDLEKKNEQEKKEEAELRKKIEQKKKETADLEKKKANSEKEFEEKMAERRKLQKESESSDKKFADLQADLDKVKQHNQELGMRVKEGQNTLEKSKQEGAKFDEQAKQFEKEVIDQNKLNQKNNRLAEEAKQKLEDQKRLSQESERLAEEAKKKLEVEEKNGKETAAKKTQTETRIKIVVEHTRQLTEEITRVEVELKEIEKTQAKSEDRLALVKKKLRAEQGKINQRCLDWTTPNRCNEKFMCQAHPKGGEICWHPTQDQKAKQCWLPKDLRVVLQDFEYCPQYTSPTQPEKGACKGLPTLEEVIRDHNGCPLQITCPSMLPPMDFTRCTMIYKCKTGGPLLDPGKGGPHGSTHAGEMVAAGNGTLTDMGGQVEEDAELATEGDAGAERNGEKEDQGGE